MKKIVSGLFIVLFVLSMSIGIFADGAVGTITYEYDGLGKTVCFAEESCFDAETRQYVADLLAYDQQPVQSRAWCWLTGHKKVTEYVLVITHKEAPIAPRCLEETYAVTTCENCDFYERTLVATSYIDCCPKD